MVGSGGTPGSRYVEDNPEAEPTTDPDAEPGVRPHAPDPGDATPLRDVSLEMIER